MLFTQLYEDISPRERFEQTPPVTGRLVIFDIDDTLVNTTTKVGVRRDGKLVKQLNSHDFTHYELQPGEEFDFGGFRDAREFFTQARPIPGMMKQLKRDIESGNKVIMLTARSDFNDRDVFLDTFRQYGIDMDRIHVYRAGNLVTKAATEEKKKIILKHLLGKHAYEKVIMYDDSVPNLNAFLSLKQDFPYTEFYAWHVDPSGQADEYHRTGLDEGLRDTLAGLALGAGVAMAPADAAAKTEKVVVSPGQTVYSIARAFDTTPQVIQRANRLDRNFSIRPGQTLIIPQPGVEIAKPETKTAVRPAAQVKPVVKQYQTAQLKTLTGTAAEAIAKRLALQQGLKGVELAAFLAQIKHESWDFTRMHEVGDKRYFQKMYDKKYKPAKAKGLGNTEFGDGVRYRGRGYMQLTGRDNYRSVGRLLGIDLERNPELAARPDIAARVALLYWKQRVRPKVKDWSNVAEVTRPINSRLSHLEDRKRDFAAYVDFYKLADQI
jgi:predicted chitinase